MPCAIGFDVATWYGLFAPIGTPKAVVAKLHRETVRVMRLPDVSGRLDEHGIEVIGSSPEELASVIEAENPFWTKILKGVKLSD